MADAPFTPRLIMLSGPSGVGKDTILTRLLERSQRYRFIVNSASRAPRPNERDGVEYDFVDVARFQELIKSGALLEWSEVYGNLYGVLKQPIRDALAAGKRPVIRIDVQGVLKIQKIIPGALTIAIFPPSLETLNAWLRSRGDVSPTDLEIRMKKSAAEIRTLFALSERHVVVNYGGRIDAAVDAVDRIVVRADDAAPPAVAQKIYNETVKALQF